MKKKKSKRKYKTNLITTLNGVKVGINNRGFVYIDTVKK